MHLCKICSSCTFEHIVVFKCIQKVLVLLSARYCKVLYTWSFVYRYFETWSGNVAWNSYFDNFFCLHIKCCNSPCLQRTKSYSSKMQWYYWLNPASEVDYEQTFNYRWPKLSLCVHIFKSKRHNLPSRLLPVSQWPHGNSFTWPHNVRLHITGTYESKCAQRVKQGA